MSDEHRRAGGGPGVERGRRRDQDPVAYARLVAIAAAQIAAQLSAAARWRSVIVMPVAGFGDQHREVLERTVGLLAAAGSPGPRLLIAVVNRPSHQVEDGAAAALERLREACFGRLELVVCRLALERRTRMGELRQVGVDALEQVLGALPAETAVLLHDDDLVALPDTALPALELGVSRGAGLAVGPVLFDDPLRPMCRYGDLFAADVLRALLGRALLRQWQDPGAEPCGDPSVLESLVFSGNLAVGRGALAAAGGFRDLNEITWLARDVLAADRPNRGLRLVDPVTSATDPATHLLVHAVRMSSRRALAAWREQGCPTVAQWRALRFTAGRVDPARRSTPPVGVPLPVRDLPAHARTSMAESFGRAAATTCAYLDPPPELVLATLPALGLADGDVELHPDRGDGWQVRVRRSGGFLDWLARTQDDELARWEAAGRDPASLALLQESDPA